MEPSSPNADNTDLNENFEDATDSPDTPLASGSTDGRIDSAAPAVMPTEDQDSPASQTATQEGKQPEAQENGVAPDSEAVGNGPIKSPLLTAHRMSRSSVDEGKGPMAQEDTSVRSVKSIASSIDQADNASRPLPTKPPPRASRFQGFSAALPSVPWGAPPRRPTDQRATSPQPPQPRKVTAPFAWLGRVAPTSKESQPPSLPERPYSGSRRNTAASISTLGSNPELSLKALDDGHEAASTRPPARTSLRDQFKILRMREEAGVTSLQDTEKIEGGPIPGLIGRSTSVGTGVGSPQSVADDRTEAAMSPVMSPQSPLPQSAAVNPNLAPGTVSGVSAALADAAMPIDWDFWQSVVNEGPQIVARTSPEEMTRAIAGGIPQTIRGVIWQVMANSKNEDLEAVYQDLRLRGTSQEMRNDTSQMAIPNGGMNGNAKGKESVASSSSSTHSDNSTPATSANVGITSPSPSHESADPINTSKLQAQLTAEKTKKVKEDSAALSKLEKMIKRDMGSRTSYSKYAVAAGLQDGLFNICKAYALFDEAVGYPQGMNFIIMPILFAMPEEEAFCLLVRLMNKYQLRELFIQDMPGLHLNLYQFERLLEDLEPALYCHLNRRGVTPKLYATQWFLTLFAYRFPLQLVMRVYDLVLCEGLEGAILKFGMAVIQRNVTALLSMNDMLALTNFLKEKVFDVYIDSTPSSKSILESGFFGSSGGTDAEVYRADLLVQDACSVKLTPEMLNKYREEWDEKSKAEKARETELETLRADLATRTVKIRSLEERAEKSDAEHIQIANELVRLKVENQELLDHNESLLGQVEELKKVADSEAASAEEKLKAEMERVRERNAEVQNQNRHMEDSMAEMEQELVTTKMKYAEINGEHDALKQKWSDLKRALE